MAMMIGGYDRLSAIGRQAWIRLSEDLRLDREVVLDRISGLIERISDAFADAAGEPEVVALNSPLPSRLVDAVASRAGALTRSKARRWSTSSALSARPGAPRGEDVAEVGSASCRDRVGQYG